MIFYVCSRCRGEFEGNPHAECFFPPRGERELKGGTSRRPLCKPCAEAVEDFIAAGAEKPPPLHTKIMRDAKHLQECATCRSAP